MKVIKVRYLLLILNNQMVQIVSMFYVQIVKHQMQVTSLKEKQEWAKFNKYRI